MSYGSNYDTIPGLVASASLAAKQFHLVKLSTTSGQVKVAAAATDAIIGVLQNNPAAGEEAEVAYQGIAKCIAGGAVTKGLPVTSNSTGRAANTTTGNNRLVGMALETTTTDGDIFPCLLSLSNH
ncbi:MAG: DUF2190 family protein [Planctomycetaceae bacterium]|nr:MAG: DUF2190 family protein [Planctomycetaceae bacterium]